MCSVYESCKRTALAIALIALSTSMAFSQSEEPAKKALNSLRDGKSALIYEIVGDFDLTAFEGANISLKHHYTDNRAYRVGVSVSIEKGDADAAGTWVVWEELETRTESMALTALKLHYSKVGERGAFYWGFGPRGSYSHTKSTADNVDPDGYGRSSSSETFSLGLLATFGVEWFVTERISLLGQYGTVVDYRKSQNRGREISENPDYSWYERNTNSSWRLYADAVRFGLSLYW